MMTRIKRYGAALGRYALLFVSLCGLFTVLMTYVFAFPQEDIKFNAQAALELLSEESLHPDLPFSVSASSMDYYTDTLMVRSAVADAPERGALYSALSVNGYSRYWHGYLVFLRPMLALGGLERIRYCHMFIIYLLIAFLFSKLQRRVHTGVAVAFLVSLVSIFVWTATISLQFYYPMALTLAGALYAAARYDPARSARIRPFFFIMGMLTSFIDLLTSPLLTLGVPLICILSIDLAENESCPFKRRLTQVIVPCLLWGVGYALCWLAKAAVASLVLKENVLQYVLSQILFRSGVEDHMGLFSRLDVVRENFQQYRFRFLGSWAAHLLPPAAVFTAIVLPFHKPFHKWKNAVPLVLTGLLPPAWFALVGNHSGAHSWYTCHSLMITAFAFACAALYVIDWDKLWALVRRYLPLKHVR